MRQSPALMRRKDRPTVKTRLNEASPAQTSASEMSGETGICPLAPVEERLSDRLHTLECIEQRLSELADDVSDLKAFKEAIYGGLRPYLISRLRWK